MQSVQILPTHPTTGLVAYTTLTKADMKVVLVDSLVEIPMKDIKHDSCHRIPTSKSNDYIWPILSQKKNSPTMVTQCSGCVKVKDIWFIQIKLVMTYRYI